MKVWPKNDQMRKALRHPINNVPFNAEGPMEWPDDSFTHRRLQDGDVLLKDPTSEKHIEDRKTEQVEDHHKPKKSS